MPRPTEPTASQTRPLTRGQANDVLRYWRASLQLEEALSTRPRARRPPTELAAPRLDTPSFGHDYFKLALDESLESLLFSRRALRKPFDPELGAFFENWLASVYRRADDDRDLNHMLAFPIVHLPRGELAGLLRYNVRVQFGLAQGEAFRVPSRAERRGKSYPTAPNEARVVPTERSGQKWPFFVDTRLLHQQLGVSREGIDSLFDALRRRPELSEREMLKLVCDLLEAELRESDAAVSGDGDDTPSALLSRLGAAMGALLARRGTRARVYPVGIVVDATRAKTTWYLQRELDKLLDDPPEILWDVDSSLGSYLTGAPLPAGAAVQRALFDGPPLSESQRGAAERCWGSRLCAVQGPPGTGKTTLILHLAAEALTRQIDALVETGAMGDALFVVTSTNNRAVDNVIDPLVANASDGPALALRAGSQKVCEQVLAPQLAQARQWLDSARKRPAAERALELDGAVDRFLRIRTQVSDALTARARSFDAQTRRETLEFEIARYATRGGEPDEASLDPRAAQILREPLDKARRRIQALCELCEATPGLAQLTAIDRHYRSSEKRVLPVLSQALASAGIELSLPLPPNLPPSIEPAELMEVWSDAAEAALASLDALHARVDRASKADAERGLVERWKRELNELVPADRNLPAGEVDEDAQRELFAAAVAVRKAWAAVEGEALFETVSLAFAAASGERSLRSLWDRGHWRNLRRLFPLWGCTLLSLGNCFPPQRDAIERLVIDEAGQCHPAYAVSALLRGRFALILGDVHQLEPVIELEPDDDLRVIESCKLSLSTDALAPYRIHREAYNSVQSLADRAARERLELREHFRCQPEIISICDALCDYGLHVLTAREGPAVPIPFLRTPVAHVDIAGEQQRLGGSWCNPAELAATLELFQAIVALGTDPNDVAVITPYRGQLEQLRKQFQRLGIPIDYSVELTDVEDAPPGRAGRGVALGTVHRFQGGERSIVLFSSVVTRRASLGFLDDRENLLNVAVSRARHRFVALGDRGVLATGRRTNLILRGAEPLAVEAFRTQLGLQL